MGFKNLNSLIHYFSHFWEGVAAFLVIVKLNCMLLTALHGFTNYLINQIEFWEWLKKSEIGIWNSFKYVVSSSYVYCNTNISWVTFEQPGLKCIPSLAWKSPRNPDKRFTTNVWILCWLWTGTPERIWTWELVPINFWKMY